MERATRNDHFDINEIDTSNTEYYLVDAMREVQYGPFNYDEYIQYCEQHDVGEMCDWIKTY